MMCQPHTNSHEALIGAVQETVSLAVSGAHHVAALPPEAQVAAAASAVAGVVAARIRPLSATAQARVDAGGDALVERRREFFTESMRGW